MKKLNKLFAILIAVLGVTTLKAQNWTDITSTYIKNPSLIADFYSSNNNSAWPVYTTGRGTSQHPKNWILHTYGTKNHNIGGAFFEAWNESSKTLRWTLFQDVTLPAGKYKLTGRYSTDQSRGIIKTVAITPHHSYYSPGITSSNWGSWGAETAEFTIYEETPVRVGMISINFAQCNGFTLETSGAKQLLADEIAAAPENLADAITTAQNVYDNAGSDDAAYISAAKELHNAVIAYNIENASVDKPVDMTIHIANPSFEGVGGSTSYTGEKHDCSEWTYTKNEDAGARSTTGSNYLNTDDSNDAFYCFNTWGGSAFNVAQTLNDMPAGRYKLTASYASDANNVATLYVNSEENGITLTATGKEHFVGGSFIYDLVADGELIIGMTSNKWYKADDFKLSYLGDPAKAAKDLLANTLAEANTIEKSTVTNAVWTMLQAAISAGNNAVDLSAIEEATAELEAAINCADLVAQPFANFNLLVTTCENILNNSQEFVEGATATFTTTVNTAKTDVEAATTADAINAVYNTLETARQTYVQQADPTNGTAFDYTFKVTNPEFNNGTTGWTSNTGAYSNTIATNQGGAITGNYYENWNDHSYIGEISQTIEGLLTGRYEFTAAAFRDQSITDATDAEAVYVFANDKEYLVNSVTPAFYSVLASSGDGSLKIGIKSVAKVYKWMGIDNVSLKYYGFDTEVAQTELNHLITEAQTLVDTPMDADAAAALNAAIAGADATKTTRNELTSMIDALNAAIEAVENWRRDYSEAKALLVAALERFEADFNDGANGALRFMPAEAWNNILNAVAEAAKAKDVLDSYDGFETAANNLHAAMDAVYASYIKYDMLENLTSLIGNADCTANDAWPGSGRSTKDDQHWSGQKRIYFAQNHENGAARSQTITLPKDGTYLLKVAVRAVEAASYAEILINGVSYKTVGAHGRTGGTIATDGTEWENIQAGIDAGKTFANNNQGYGWVYTYIYFDAKAGENTIAINLSNFNSSREANCGGMELYYLRPNYTVVEDGVVEYYGEFDEVTGTAYATHDVTNATLKENSIDVTANPNTFIIANENQVSNEDNVIVDGTVASLVLNEGYAFYAATDFTATAATYSREFTKDTWLTVCLPFAYDVPENVEVETLSTVEADTKTFVFNKVDVMEANKPYIIKNGTEKKALFTELSNAEVKATPDAMSVSAEEGNAEFIGTYTTVTTDALMENGTYDILFFGTDGQLYYLSDGINQNVITIDPFRAYIRLPKGIIDWENGAAQAIARHGEGTTGIENSTLNTQPSTVIYDLMGRKVTNMVKGNMYIVNGKKVIVK